MILQEIFTAFIVIGCGQKMTQEHGEDAPEY